MDAISAVKEAARRAGIPTTKIGPALGKDRSCVATAASRGVSPQADNLAAMLGVCGYVLCAIPCGDVPTSAIKVE